jgi:DNA mismatch repair protein MutS
LTPYEEKKEKLKKIKAADENQISMFEIQDDKIRKEIDDIAINDLTPVEALNKLNELKKRVKEKT